MALWVPEFLSSCQMAAGGKQKKQQKQMSLAATLSARGTQGQNVQGCLPEHNPRLVVAALACVHAGIYLWRRGLQQRVATFTP